jgi:predicted  nucleic acid-binding Zn-ribbon protein
MGWKDELITANEKLDRLTKLLVVISRKVEDVERKVDHQSRSSDRMADRLIEMAMVNKNMGREAVSHRRALEEETPSDLWQDTPETEWPPKGHDALTMP